MNMIYLKRRRLLSVILMIAMLHASGGCSYYKIKKHPSPDKTVLTGQALNSQKYIILHSGEGAWHLTNITLNAEGTAMNGDLEDLPPEHLSYLVKSRHPGPRRYRPAKSSPTYEVHIYLSDAPQLKVQNNAIPLSEIRRIDVYDKDVMATVGSYVGATLAVAAGIVVIVAIVALATKSSCPFVYVKGANGWRFAGEMYGGAIYAPLERDDYMPLPGIAPTADGTYKLKIANELQERQYTNIAELIVVDYPANTIVITDQSGRPQTISAPEAPVTALSGTDADHAAMMAARDSSSYLFDEEDRDNSSLSSLTLRFKKPPAAKSGKLVLHAKNSFWLDYMFGQFTALFGTRYDEFAESQKRVPAAQSRQWSRDQAIPLTVLVETPKGWEPAGYIETMGPLAGRDLVIPMDLSKIPGDAVRVKLQCGTMFWEVDYAAMDFSVNIPVTVRHIAATSAIDEDGKDVTALIAATDAQYLTQPQPGNEVLATYPAPKLAPGYQRSVFFHSRGYYEYIRHFTNKPDLLYLASFKKKGAFTKFASQHYHARTQQPHLFTSALNN